MTDYKLSSGVVPQKPSDMSPLIFALIWGLGGVGKTTFACTLPGRKLLVNFDPRGYQSVATRDDVLVADFASVDGTALTSSFKSDTDPLGLNRTLKDFDSYIFDSLTTVGEIATARGIQLTNGATVERPSPGAYGARNALVLQLVTNALRFCSKNGKHCCFIAHEDAPVKDKEGALVSIPIYLGGKLPNNASLRLSEVWAMYDLGVQGTKTMAIRQCRMRNPMKTRMFDTMDSPEFTLKYNPNLSDDDPKNKGQTISQWHDAWVANGMKKIPLPK